PLLLAACASSSGSVLMRNPETGQVAQCGPYAGYAEYSNALAAAELRSCVGDLRDEGFEQVQ
ncbi:MAG: hypothetical protein ACE5Q3_14945, partial [Alphaproteobacteria bacterium]